jgi:hypothetical protein
VHVYGGCFSTGDAPKIVDEGIDSCSLDHARFESTIHAAAPNFNELALRTGWGLDHLSAIMAYRDSAVRYYFPTAEQVLAVFAERAPAFTLQHSRRPSYQLGECCPVIILRKSAES